MTLAAAFYYSELSGFSLLYCAHAVSGRFHMTARDSPIAILLAITALVVLFGIG